MEVRCPYCSGEMKPCGSMVYRTRETVRVADWVRCVRCKHATVVNKRGFFGSPAASPNHTLALA